MLPLGIAAVLGCLPTPGNPALREVSLRGRQSGSNQRIGGRAAGGAVRAGLADAVASLVVRDLLVGAADAGRMRGSWGRVGGRFGEVGHGPAGALEIFDAREQGVTEESPPIGR